MVNFQIIKARSGLNTNEQILRIMANYPQGVTISEISREINRPVSMVSICLKNLVSQKKIAVKFSQNKKYRHYHNVTKIPQVS